jgi:hypothetical protein
MRFYKKMNNSTMQNIPSNAQSNLLRAELQNRKLQMCRDCAGANSRSRPLCPPGIGSIDIRHPSCRYLKQRHASKGSGAGDGDVGPDVGDALPLVPIPAHGGASAPVGSASTRSGSNDMLCIWQLVVETGVGMRVSFFVSAHAYYQPYRLIIWRAIPDDDDGFDLGGPRRGRLRFDGDGLPDFSILYGHLASVDVAWGDVVSIGVRACTFHCVEWDTFVVDSVLVEFNGLVPYEGPRRAWVDKVEAAIAKAQRGKPETKAKTRTGLSDFASRQAIARRKVAKTKSTKSKAYGIKKAKAKAKVPPRVDGPTVVVDPDPDGTDWVAKLLEVESKVKEFKDRLADPSRRSKKDAAAVDVGLLEGPRVANRADKKFIEQTLGTNCMDWLTKGLHAIYFDSDKGDVYLHCLHLLRSVGKLPSVVWCICFCFCTKTKTIE